MAVTVVLMRKDELFRYRLEEGHSVTFGSHKRIMYMWKDFPEPDCYQVSAFGNNSQCSKSI